jgi:hypothetical protein
MNAKEDKMKEHVKAKSREFLHEERENWLRLCDDLAKSIPTEELLEHIRQWGDSLVQLRVFQFTGGGGLMAPGEVLEQPGKKPGQDDED